MKKFLLLGLAMAFVVTGAMAFYPVVSNAAGLTAEQISAIMNLLSSFGADQSVVNNVQVSLSGGTPTISTGSQPGGMFCYNWTTNLSLGNGGQGGGTRARNYEDNSVGALITALSKEGLLNYDQVVQPGSAGSSMKATYFSETVASAVVAFQEKYASEILAPAGLSHGTGFVGASTRAKLNQLYRCDGVTVTPPNTAIQSGRINIISPVAGINPINSDGTFVIKWTDSREKGYPPSYAISLMNDYGKETIVEKESQASAGCVNGGVCSFSWNPKTSISPTKNTIVIYDTVNDPQGNYAVYSGNFYISPVNQFSATVSASLLPSTIDGAGIWGVFKAGPGAGGVGGTTDSADWNFSATINLPSDKTISNVTLRQTNTEYWSTNNSKYFPLVIVDDSGHKLTEQYVDNLGKWTTGTYNWKLYAQKNTSAWVGGSLTVNFSDGTSAVATIPAMGSNSNVTNYHPADTNQDWRISLSELNGYGAKYGNTAGYQNAYTIYMNGESYIYDLSVNSWRSATTTKSTITLLSPNGGNYKVGDQVSIQWKSTGSRNVEIYLEKKSDLQSWEVYKINGSGVNDYVSPSGLFIWQIPKSVYWGGQTVALTNGTYQVRVNEIGAKGDEAIARSYPFTITDSTSTTQPSITVLSPNGGEVFNLESPINVSWLSNYGGGSSRVYLRDLESNSFIASYTSQPISVSIGKNLYSIPANSVTKPGKYKLEICIFDQYHYGWRDDSCDSSDNSFTITAPTTTTKPTVTVLTPSNSNGGTAFKVGDSMRLQWSTQNMVGYRKILLIPVDAKLLNPITVADTNGYPSSVNYYDWIVPSSVPSGQYYVQVQMDSDASGIIGTSSGYVTISQTTTQPSITVLSPNGGENYTVNGGLTISWAQNNAVGPVTVQVFNNVTGMQPYKGTFGGGTGKTKITLSSTDLQGTSSGQYRVTVCDEGSVNSSVTFKPLCDSSDNSFTITAPTTTNQPSVTVLTPTSSTGSTSFTTGSTMNIQWTSKYITGVRKIQLVPTSGSNQTISVLDLSSVQVLPLTTNSYSWTIPSTAQPGSYNIRIVMGYDDGTGTVGITTSPVTITTPTVSSGLSISSVSPSSGPAGTAVTISGSGFSSNGNSVNFTCPATGSGAGVPSIPSSDGKTLKVTMPGVPIPSTFSANSANCTVTVSNADGLNSSAVFSLTIPSSSVVSKPTLIAQLLSSSDDKAGTWGVFAPGAGYGGTSAADWNISATLTLSAPKTMKYATLTQTNGEIWSTNNPSNFPLVIIENGAQRNSGYTSDLGSIYEGSHSWKIYAQKNTSAWVGGALTIYFSDGTSVTANITPLSTSNMTSSVFNALQLINPSLYSNY